MKKMIEEWKAKAGKAAGENTKVEDTVKKVEELQRDTEIVELEEDLNADLEPEQAEVKLESEPKKQPVPPLKIEET